MKTAVHFGAGNIGRGFIGDLLYSSGYSIIFVDIDVHMIEELNKYHEYNICILDKNRGMKTIKNVSALHSQNNRQDVISAIVDCALLTTSVWADNLGKIAGLIAEGLEQRILQKKTALNLLACENALYATDMLKMHIIGHLKNMDSQKMESYISFPNAAVDRAVFNSVREGRSVVEAGSYFELAIQKDRLINPSSEPIKGAFYTDNLAKYLERKLYIVNASHASMAYLGFVRGFDTVQDALKDSEIYEVVSGVMDESIEGLIKKFDFTRDEMNAFKERTLKHFAASYLSDSVLRVGRSPIRKLSPNDRLVGPMQTALDHGVNVQNFPKVIAAAFLFQNPEDIQSLEIQEFIAQNGIGQAVCRYTGIEDGSKIHTLILEHFNRFKDDLGGSQ